MITISHLTKTFTSSAEPVTAVNDVSFTVADGTLSLIHI